MQVNPIAKKIVEALFSGSETVEIGGQIFQRRVYKNNTVRAFDINGYRWVEQNPNTLSFYAQLAQKGAKVVWVIKQDTNDWQALIVDGVMHRRVNGKWQAFQGI